MIHFSRRALRCAALATLLLPAAAFLLTWVRLPVSVPCVLAIAAAFILYSCKRKQVDLFGHAEDDFALPPAAVLAVVLCALGYVLRPLMPGLADMFRHLGFIWIGYGVFALLLKQPKETRARTVCSLTRSILSYTAVLLSVFFGLRALGVDVTASLASVGVVTLIIGFGAQSLIEDVLTGIFLIAEGRYNVGDILVLDDFRGKVVDISVRTTTLEDSGGNHKIINNSEIRNFQNRSQKTSVAVSTISIGYDADLRAVEAVIADALPAMYEENRGVFLDVPQYIGVEELAGSGVVLKFIVSATEENIFAARRALNRSLKLLFDEKGIDIPYPQLTVHTK